MSKKSEEKKKEKQNRCANQKGRKFFLLSLTLVCFLLLFAGIGMASATTYYISTSGDNVNRGTGLDSAWASLSHAQGQLSAGDTLLIADGTYYNDRFVAQVSGTADNPITIKAYSGTPTFIESGTTRTLNLFSFHDWGDPGPISYYNIEGLRVENYYRPFFLMRETHHINIKHMSGDQCRSFFFAGRGCHDILTEDMHINGGHWNSWYLWHDNHHITAKDVHVTNQIEHCFFDLHTNNDYITLIDCTADTSDDNSPGVYIGHGDYGTDDNVRITNFRYTNVPKGNMFWVWDPGDNLYIDTAYSEGSDGVEFMGTGKNLIMKNAHIKIGDSIPTHGVYFTSVDDIDGVLLDNIKVENVDSAQYNYDFKFESGFDVIKNVTMRDVYGAGNDFVIRVGDGEPEGYHTLEYTDGKVFSMSSVTPQYYPDKSMVPEIKSAEVSEVSDYPMTASPSSGAATVTVNKYDTSLPKGEPLVDFAASTTNGNNVVFTVGDLKPYCDYTIKRDGVFLTTKQTGSSGDLQFSNSEWTSAHIFTIEESSSTNQPPVADSSGPYTGTEGAEIVYDGNNSYDSDGSIDSYLWDFGDGNTATGVAPTHTYTQDGTYTVTLTVTDNEGATNTSTTTATIADTEPTADFSATPTSGQEPLTVMFTDNSASYDGIETWNWDFDNDGVTDSTEQNPTHAFAEEGVYTVSLTVTESDGDSDAMTKQGYITVTKVNELPVADPSGPYTGTEGVAIAYDGINSYDPDGSIDSYLWDFGDGNTATGVAPTHTYAQDGTYTVALTVTDKDDATSMSTTTATIADTEPTADFSATPTNGQEPLAVAFTDNSASYDGIETWDWDFDNDGVTDSTEQNPTHAFAEEGVYTVSLTVTESDEDSDTMTKQGYITVTKVNELPVADLSGPYAGTEGVAIAYDGSNSYDPDGSIDSYLWDFGDGNTATGVAPTHTYAQDGTYTVTLTVTDNEGATNTSTTTATIADTEPTAAFSAAPTSGQEPLTVTFTDNSASYDGIETLDWDFDNDGVTDSTEQNPTYEYAEDGVYTVTLTITESDEDSDTMTKEGYITVTKVNELPVADPSGPYTGTEGVAIVYDGSNSYDPDGTIDSYLWDFGDGNTATGVAPTHTYAQDGTYTVTLTVTDNEGATNTSTTTATIADTEPTADFSATPTSGQEPLTVMFTDNSASYDGIETLDWDFDNDGVTDSTVQNPTYEYAEDGVYTVSLTVTESDKDSDTITKQGYITVTKVNEPPVADPSGPHTGTEGAEIAYDGSNSYDPDGTIDSYLWDFGDGNTATGVAPTHTYAQDGTYTVALTVTDKDDATDISTTTATIADTEPTAAFSAAPTHGLEPLTVSFTDNSASYDGIETLDWDFDNDGVTDSTEQNPTYEYAEDGVYTVSLTVTESDKDSDTITKQGYITVTKVNELPVVDPSGPYTGTEGVAIVYDGSNSYDPDGTIDSYLWDFGDGNTATGVAPTHTYAQEGTYTVTLTVTDNEGATNTSTTTATIADTEPTAAFSAAPTSGQEPLTVTFTDNSASYDGIETWNWDFDNDGVTDSTEQNPTHAFAEEGVYTVTLTITESDGDSDAMTKQGYITVTKVNAPPVADPSGPYTSTEGAEIDYDGSNSYDPDGTIDSYLWDFGDGNTATGVAPTHTYAQDGTYTVALTVTDNDDETSTSTTTATIADTEPTAAFSAARTHGPAPLTVAFTDKSASYDGIETWNWDFDNDGLADSTEQNPTHVYLEYGRYTVSLTVTESDGDSGTMTKADYITGILRKKSHKHTP